MMKTVFFRVSVLVGLLVFAAGSVHAMRCGTHIIGAGDRSGNGKYEVLKKCGEPKVRDGYSWIYEKYGNTYVVTFDSAGRVSSIR
jgi:hypothetical protein